MQIKQLTLENWKNFRRIELPIGRRLFIIGPNASGKSNLLDALRFVRDVANPEGGFQRAIRTRGGVSQIRCLHARKQPNIAVDLSVLINGTAWRYRLEFKQDKQRRALVEKEQVWKNAHRILYRPDTDDELDPNRLSQTHLEQVNANKEFRVIAEMLAGIRYLHVVPQLVREPDRVITRSGDPFGSDFLERMARTPKRILNSRFRRINEALRVAVPQLRELKLERDERGIPHIKGLYEHWRPKAGWQTEEQFSDGTIRLLGLLWSLMDGSKPLLLEEPELSLHTAVVQYVPVMMQQVTSASQRQVFVSTHSTELLTDKGISPDEVLVLSPTSDGTHARLAGSYKEVTEMVRGGVPIGDAVIPLTAPKEAHQLALFR